MRKFILSAALILVSLASFAQMQIKTKKYIISDIPEKTMKVVQTGEDVTDAIISRTVRAKWNISSYEFCSLEEFEKIRSSEKYYFLVLTQGRFKGESAPGVEMLTVLKGGSGDSLDEMYEVVSLPIGKASALDFRSVTFLPAMVEIVQSFLEKALKSDAVASGGITYYAKSNSSAIKNKSICFNSEDLAADVDETFVAKKFDASMTISEDADDLFEEEKYGTLVSYVVAPEEPEKGSFSYQMLIDANTHELYYFSARKLVKDFSVGFSSSDIKSICSKRK